MKRLIIRYSTRTQRQGVLFATVFQLPHEGSAPIVGPRRGFVDEAASRMDALYLAKFPGKLLNRSAKMFWLTGKDQGVRYNRAASLDLSFIKMSDTHRITELLQAWSAGDSQALDKLIPLVDQELKQIARAYMRNEKQGHTLQTTALVVEAFIRLMQGGPINWQNRHQFYAIVAKRMRQVLIDYARQKLASRRGHGAERVNIDDVFITSEQSEELLLLHEALEKLAKLDDRKAKIVEFRYFGGFSFNDVAEMLGVSLSTVEREWGLARAWLKREMTPTQ